MPSLPSSPPLLRQNRSSPGRRASKSSISTPPPPSWESPAIPIASSTSGSKSLRAKSTPTLTPRLRQAPPVPPFPHVMPASTGSTSTMPPSHTTDTLPPPSPRMSSITTPISRSSSSSSSSSTSPRITTPPPRRSRSNTKLLPALPLSVDTQLSPPSRKKRNAVVSAENVESGEQTFQIIISRDQRDGHRSPKSPNWSRPNPTLSPGAGVSPLSSPSLHSFGNDTPPRPARRSPATRRSDPNLPLPGPTSDLLPPQPTCFRTQSPSGDSISTISECASTPRAAASAEIQEILLPPTSNLNLAPLSEVSGSSAPLRKRDSAQRRLSALRGLVANLDFNQPWSLSEPTEEEEEGGRDGMGFFWACSDPPPVTPLHTVSPVLAVPAIPVVSPTNESTESISVRKIPTVISSPVPLVHEISPHRSRSRRNTNATPSDTRSCTSAPAPSPSRFFPDQALTSPPVPVPELPRSDSFSRINVTPQPMRREHSGQGSGRKTSNSTPPRRPRQFRSSSDLLSRTPDPPRPSSRQRKEVFEVASSGYSKCFEAEPTSPSVSSSTPTTTWRSSLSNEEIYRTIMNEYGPSEVKRQEIIWELCETEHAFIKSMRTVLRLFAIPLKTPQGKWIHGIPPRITELFDSLESVAHAHGIISAIQRDIRRKSEMIDVRAFVTSFNEWVPRLEVHEWYLLRFEAVVQLVEDNVRDPDSVFGEFVRMQMKEEVLGSMSLGSMLLKPVQRLTKYPLFLRRLLDVTPFPHPCHPELLALLSNTESIILNLQAAKAREEDYEQLQNLESHIQGLPAGFTLAVRGRKLLGQGSVSRVLPQGDLSPSIHLNHNGNGSNGASADSIRNRANSLHSSRGSISSSVSGYSSPWDFYGGLILTPSTCRTSAFSISSSASSYCPPSRTSSFSQASSSSPQRPSVSRSPSTASSIVVDSVSSISHSSTSPRPSTPSSSSSLRGLRKKHNSHEEFLTMLIFNDVVVIATEASDKNKQGKGLFGPKRKSEKNLRVVQEMEGGVGKVVEAKDWSGWQGHSTLFTITMVPLGSSSSQPLSPVARGAYTTAFTLPTLTHNSLGHAATSTPTSKSYLSCPTLNTLQTFMNVLAQTTASPGRDHHHSQSQGEEDIEEEEGGPKEVLETEEYMAL